MGLGDVLGDIWEDVVQPALPMVLQGVAAHNQWGVYGQRNGTGGDPFTPIIRQVGNSTVPLSGSAGFIGIPGTAPGSAPGGAPGGDSWFGGGLLDDLIDRAQGQGQVAVGTSSRGIRFAGQVPAMFHTTRCGNVVPNRVTATVGPNGDLAYFIDAGRPTAWSKATIKKRRCCRKR